MKSMFSNGSEHLTFEDNFCCRCSKLSLDTEGMPFVMNCEIEEAVYTAMFDNEKFPDENIMRLESGYWACDSFEANDKDVQKLYKKQILPEIKKLQKEAKE